MSMRRRWQGLGGVLLFLVTGLAQAALLGISPGQPDVFFQQPVIFPNPTDPDLGYVQYDANSNVLKIKGEPRIIQLPNNTIAPYLVPNLPASLHIEVILDESGNVSGVAGGVDGNGNDLVLSGTTPLPFLPSPQLTGTIVELGFADTNPGAGGGEDDLQLRFVVTGGSLAGDFAGFDIGIDMVIESSQFPDNFWGNNVTVVGSGSFNRPKGNLGPIPMQQLCSGVIGDRLWFDVDADAAQDGGESGLNGVTVELYEDQGGNFVLIESVDTAGDGLYEFTELCAGDYRVIVDGNDLTGGLDNPTFDYDGIGTPNSADVTLASDSSENRDVDFGYTGSGLIGDRVWFDIDGDGVQDGGEPGLGGVTVTLKDDQGGVLATTTTTADGSYLFPNLPAGDYVVEVDDSSLPPSATTATFDFDGTGTPHVAAVSLAAGEEQRAVDFGYNGPGMIGDRVWYDIDGDGVQDGGEPGISGVTVTLSADFNGDAIIDYTATAVTNGNGLYSFPSLPTGTYSVAVDTGTLPAGFTDHTFDRDGDLDSDSGSVVLPAGGTDLGFDFGYRGAGALGDTVWFDINGTPGVQDPNEPGLPNITVEMAVDWNGDSVVDYTATTITDANGNYGFTSLPAGSYSVTVVTPPAGLSQTYDLDGLGSANSASLSLGLAETNLDVDFGYTGLGMLGDTVWLDLDANGVQDSGEPGIPNVTVELRMDLDGDGDYDDFIVTDVTDANGLYIFGELPAADYQVAVITGTLPAGVAPTYDLDGISSAHVAELTLGQQESRMDVDFGYVGLGAIGDFVWEDVNADGLQAGELANGLPGVTVTLSGPYGLSLITSTDSLGGYLFDGLPAGSYVIDVDGNSVPFLVNPILTTNNDPSAVNLAAGEQRLDVDFGYVDALPELEVMKTTNGFDADTATGPFIAVGDSVTWEYIVVNNGNVPLVDVELNDDKQGYVCTIARLEPGFSDSCSLIGSALVGQYMNLVTAVGQPVDPITDAPINGTVQATDPSHYFGAQPSIDIEKATEGEDADTATGPLLIVGDSVTWSYVVTNTGNTTLTALSVSDDQIGAISCPVSQLAPGASTTCSASGTVTAGQYANLGSVTAQPVDSEGQPFGDTVSDNDPSHYLGLELASLAGFVYVDSDNDGQFDGTEQPIEGVTITLTGTDDQGNSVNLSTTTAADGSWSFTGLVPGLYTVTESQPSDYVDGKDTQGTPGNGIVNNDQFADIDLDSGVAGENNNFGEIEFGSIGDTIFYDDNGNGVQDNGELGVAGVTVTLGGDSSATAITDSNGNYLFDQLPAGDYTVTVSNGVGTPLEGLDNTADPDGGFDSASAVTLGAGESNLDQDFGYQRLGSIGDTIFFDDNGNGVQDNGELGVAGVTVTLGGDSSATAVTDSNGNYLFDQLPAGDYTVTVSNGVGTPLEGLNNTADPDGGFDSASAVTLGAGEENLDQDFGYQRLGSIGDTIFFDDNGNGVQDNGELGVAGVTVTLGGDSSATAVTDSNGNYLFDQLPAGDYTVTVSNGVGTPLEGLSNTADPDGGFDSASAVTLGAGEENLDQDFGYLAPLNLGDFIWNDANGDGIQDADEEGIAGATVTLFEADGTTPATDLDGNSVAAQTTAADGLYNFTHLAPGDYVVKVTAPSGFVTTVGGADPDDDSNSDSNGQNSGSNVTSSLPVTLSSGDEPSSDGDGANGNLSVDFGFYEPASLGDFVWEDLDRDGQQESGEPGIAGVTVTLLDAAMQTLATTTTAADGSYSFTDLAPGDYFVQFATPAGYQPTLQDIGDDSSDSDASTTDGKSAQIDLVSGENDPTIDAGFFRYASLGDYVWFDADLDGQQDGSESPVGGVTVNLRDGNGNLLESTTTAANGSYLFDQLLPGDYIVEFIAPNGTLFTSANVGNDASDSDANPANGRTGIITLESNESDLTNDAGLVQLGSLGDYVWLDVNQDGIQNDGATGVPSVLVLLSGTDGFGNSVSRSTTTDSNGLYGFGDLLPGSYTVTFLKPFGYDFTAQNQGSDDSLDSDADISSGAVSVTLGFGEDNLTIDAGLTDGTTPPGGGICLPSEDFEEFAAGTKITDQIPGMTISTDSNKSAMIFDTANPTGGDPDLGTPNQDFGGPGVGNGGKSGTPGENSVALGKVLIISEDGDSGDPDDNAGGGTLIFTFDQLVRIDQIALLDIEESGGEVRLYSAGGSLIKSVAIPGVGDNSYQELEILGDNVARMEVELAGSGAVGSIDYCLDETKLCVDEANTDQYGGNGGHAVWMPGISSKLLFEPVGEYVTQNDGTAVITAVAVDENDANKRFKVVVSLENQTTTPPPGSPKLELASAAYVGNGGPVDPATWFYYDDFTATLYGQGAYDGAVIELIETGPAWQFGDGANGKNVTNGASTWFDWTVTTQPTTGISLPATGKGDFNLDIISCEIDPGVAAIDIRKQAEGPDSRAFAPGATVDFEIVVTNSGDLDLTDVVVVDPITPACDTTIGFLAAGDSSSYSCSTTLGSGGQRVFRDTFSDRAYDNNDGSHDFAGPWVEHDVQGAGPLSGNVVVGSNNKLWLDDKPNTGTDPSAARTADLSGALSAELSFDWYTHKGVDKKDKVIVEISSDGGASYSELDRFTGFSGSRSGHESYDISDYASAQTTLRFRIAKGYGGKNETFKVDNVEIVAEMGGEGFVNEACATGSAGADSVEDCDTSTVTVEDFVAQPAIDVRKQAEGADSRSFYPGDLVSFDIAVTNTGNVDLENVLVSDPAVPACDYTVGYLAVGASDSYTCHVQLATGTSRSYRDEFNHRAYDNNDGSDDFSGPWVEDDVAGAGATSGNVIVGSNNKLWLDDKPDTRTHPSAARTADLAGATDATLSFDWWTHHGVDTSDEVVVEISSDGGANYEVLHRFTGFSGSKSGHKSFDISAWASAQTTVRFRVTKYYGGSDETFKVDNLEMSGEVAGGEGFINEACASGSYQGESVNDCDTSEVVVEQFNPQPAVDIRKQAEGEDSRSFAPGAMVPFEIVVTNTGNVELTNLLVSDPLAPQCDQMIGSLAVGASESYSCEMQLGGGAQKEFKDTFSQRAFDNNDGSHDWSGPWMENDVAGAGAYAGNVIVGSNNKLWLDDNPNTGTTPSAARTADLSGATEATLSFEWHTHHGVDHNDEVLVEISSDGGAQYDTLEAFTGFSGSRTENRSYDISNWISSETTVRFRVTNLYGGSNETFKVDDLTIVAEGAATGFTNEACVAAWGAGIEVNDCDTSTVEVDHGGDDNGGHGGGGHGDGAGCTPGYWKQAHHYNEWPTPYSPNTKLKHVFDRWNTHLTLGEALKLNGGGEQALARHAAAAVLNASHPGVSYELSASEVIKRVDRANHVENEKDYLDGLNSCGCPL